MSVEQLVINSKADEDFNKFIALNISEKTCIIWYHATWCGYCKEMKEAWLELENYLKKEKLIDSARINKDIIGDLKLDYKVSSYPTIVLKQNNGNIIYFTNPERTLDKLINFIKTNLSTKQKGGYKKKKTKRKKRTNNKKKRKKSTFTNRKQIGAGVLDSIESKLQVLENLVGNNSFE